MIILCLCSLVLRCFGTDRDSESLLNEDGGWHLQAELVCVEYVCARALRRRQVERRRDQLAVRREHEGATARAQWERAQDLVHLQECGDEKKAQMTQREKREKWK